jgi:PAS domain S-box-containing protein
MDVTAAKLAEQTLRESSAYLAEAQRLSHTGSWARVYATGETRYFSEECYRVLGFEPLGGPPRFETFLQRVRPEDQAKVMEITERAGREKVGYELDYRIVHPGGEFRDIHVVAHPVFNPSGGLVEYVGTVMDVTERRRAEEKLRQSEAYLAEAQKLTRTGSWVWAVVERRALHLSEEWYRLYGFDPNEGIPDWNKPVQRMHPHDRARWQQVFDRAISEKSDYEAEYRIHLPDGAVRHIHSVGHPVLDTSGKLVQFVGSSSDVTERKQAEEALRQAQADLARTNRVTTMGELTASLAHEINQPIAAAATDANTCLRWLTRDQPDLEEARAAASRVVKDAARAAEIMSRIRSLFKKEISQRELVDVNDILQGMIELLRSEATRYSISVRTELSDDLPQIMGDRVQLQQVTMNLIINSIDAMKDVEGTREIIITSQQAENEQLQVSVSDTGVGLPAEQGNRSSMHSLRPSLTAPAWDFASASQSLSRMAAGYGRPTTLRAAPASISHYPVLAQRSRSRSADTGLRCGQPKPAAIRRKPGTKIGRRRICRSGAEVTLAADQSVNRVSALTITVNCPII